MKNENSKYTYYINENGKKCRLVRLPGEDSGSEDDQIFLNYLQQFPKRDWSRILKATSLRYMQSIPAESCKGSVDTFIALAKLLDTDNRNQNEIYSKPTKIESDNDDIIVKLNSHGMDINITITKTQKEGENYDTK